MVTVEAHLRIFQTWDIWDISLIKIWFTRKRDFLKLIPRKPELLSSAGSSASSPTSLLLHNSSAWKIFTAPRLPLYKIGVPYYQNHCIIMMGRMLSSMPRREEKCSKFKRKHFSEMSDGIFYYPKYLLYGKFIYIFWDRAENDTKQAKHLSVLYEFQSVFIWMTIKNNFLLKPPTKQDKPPTPFTENT